MGPQATAILALLVGAWLGFLIGAVWAGMNREYRHEEAKTR